MALTNCAQCGGQVSTLAKKCPHCGKMVEPAVASSLGGETSLGPSSPRAPLEIPSPREGLPTVDGAAIPPAKPTAGPRPGRAARRLSLFFGLGLAAVAAVALFYRAQLRCEAGSAEMCSVLGDRASSRGDTMGAHGLYQRACQGDFAPACTRLGELYERGGAGLAQDYARAGVFFQRACDGASAEGCLHLGKLYAAGRGLRRDEVRARELLEKACAGGLAEGCTEGGSQAELEVPVPTAQGPEPAVEVSTEAMKDALRNLVTLQERYFADNVTYASNIGALNYSPQAGVTIGITAASGTGWSATATGAASPRLCGIFVGSAPPPVAGQAEGTPSCEGERAALSAVVRGSSDESNEALMKSDLRNLVTAEEAYFAENVTYAGTISNLNYSTSRGTTVTIVSASGTGWSATAKNIATAKTCAIYVGSATPPITGQSEGAPTCR